ncbi:MAG TPA: permease, partial [Terriglobia bacterium]|nr:permease [Terriglobia bacterium]
MFQVVVLATIVVLLVNYKGGSGLQRIQQARASGGLQVAISRSGAPPGTSALGSSLRYLNIVWPALLFGIAISAAARVGISRMPLGSVLGRGSIRDQLTGAIAGAPLMLCSCCAAPIFHSIYEKTRRAGPGLALTLASSSFNPVALTLSFMLFPARIAWARMLMACVFVLSAAGVADRLAAGGPAPRSISDPPQNVNDGWLEFLSAYPKSLLHIFVRTVPLILVGILVSMWIMRHIPWELSARIGTHTVITILVALFSVLLTLPSLFEIPLALSIMATGGPSGAVAALLFAGPAVNLPSLLVMGRSGGWKLAASLTVIVWSIAAL